MNDINQFEKNIISLHGEAGKAWLKELPNIISQIAGAWNLTNLAPFENLSYNYALSGFQQNKPVVLKISFKAEDLLNELSALEAFSGLGTVHIHDKRECALLLECAIPGNALKTYLPERKQEALEIICKIAQQLHLAPIPNHHTFPHIQDWLATLDKDWNIPGKLGRVIN